MNDDQPLVERPDEHAEIGDELYCWLPGNDDRECNGSCVAYEAGYTEDQRRDSCKVLNAVRSASMSIAKLANISVQKAKAAAVPQQPPPEVR